MNNWIIITAPPCTTVLANSRIPASEPQTPRFQAKKRNIWNPDDAFRQLQL